MNKPMTKAQRANNILGILFSFKTKWGMDDDEVTKAINIWKEYTRKLDKIENPPETIIDRLKRLGVDI